MNKFIQPNPTKSVKWRAFTVYAYTMVFTLGCIAALFGGLNSFGLVSDKGLKGFWEFAPFVSVTVGIITAVHYMYKELKAEADYFKMLYEEQTRFQGINN